MLLYNISHVKLLVRITCPGTDILAGYEPIRREFSIKIAVTMQWIKCYICKLHRDKNNTHDSRIAELDFLRSIQCNKECLFVRLQTALSCSFKPDINLLLQMLKKKKKKPSK
jgi:hypothetical protein